MNADLLRSRVYCLSERLSGLGIGADIYALTITELWALYAFLQRMVELMEAGK
jgi:hypothetical protein